MDGIIRMGTLSRGYVPDVVFDIGAADGSWTRQALQIWPDSHYVCFEPLTERRATLAALLPWLLINPIRCISAFWGR